MRGDATAGKVSKGGMFVYHRTCWRRGTEDDPASRKATRVSSRFKRRHYLKSSTCTT